MNETKIQNNVLNSLNKAKQENIDILVFPEMLGSEILTSEVLNQINSSLDEFPPLIVLPTVCKNQENVADIILGSGEKIIKQHKQFGMIMDSAKEYIRPDNLLYVLHIPHLGRICIMICKDFLMMDYLDKVLKDVNASMIIVPSFSTGNFDFKSMISHCIPYDTDIIWINSCSAKHLSKKPIDNFKEIGYVLKSGYNSNEIEKFEVKENCTDCKNGNCLKKIEIPMNIRR